MVPASIPNDLLSFLFLLAFLGYVNRHKETCTARCSQPFLMDAQIARLPLRCCPIFTDSQKYGLYPFNRWRDRGSQKPSKAPSKPLSQLLPKP